MTNSFSKELDNPFSGLPVKAKPKVCLTMIVRNESKIIQRCLNRAKFAFDYICITDTGSEDNTINLIQDWAQEHQVPAKVCQDTWLNFGHNRSLSVKNALQHFPTADYLLLLDADMKLEDHGFDRSQLTHTHYRVLQYGGGITHPNIRLIDTKRAWHYRCVTHEYCTAPDDQPAGWSQLLTTLKIDDAGDGGCKANKFRRDYGLLTEAVKDTKDRDYTRHLFYLARTCKDLGLWEEALTHYQTRTIVGGFIEEVWHSYHDMADIYYRQAYQAEDKKDYYVAKFTQACLEAHLACPHRIETLTMLASHYRINNKPNLAYNLIKPSLKLKKPVEGLFIQDLAYDFSRWFEVCVCAYYAGDYLAGHYACLYLLNYPNLTADWKQRIEGNHQYYLQVLGPILIDSLAQQKPDWQDQPLLYFQQAK